MALSAKTKKRIEVALARRAEANELIAAVESGANEQAAAVADMGATVAVGSTDGSGGAGDAALAADVEARLDDIEAKIDELLAAMRAANQLAP